MEVRKTLHMNGGDGETSYANNSALQKVVLSKTWRVLDETLRDMFTQNNNSFPKCTKIADLGCSSGPNTLFLVSHITDTIQDLCETNNDKSLPQLEVLLNDVPENDFNNLFKLLSNFDSINGKQRKLECFIYGVPGSFYGRLFPSNSLHFAYSANSLHWLSQIPEGLGKTNKENIFIATTSPPQVFEAYAKQFQRDFSSFLSSRAEEITSGGRMVLAFLGRSSTSTKDPSFGKEYLNFSMLAEVLLDMVTLGLVKNDDLHSFNIPIHAPFLHEIEETIHVQGSFHLDMIEVVRVPLDPTIEYDEMVFDTYESGKRYAGTLRSAMEPLLTPHFGSSIVDGVFDRYATKMAEYLCKSKERLFLFSRVISLSRKLKG